MTLKALMEKRNDLLVDADKLVSTAETEKRSISVEERTQFDSIKAEIEGLDVKIKEIRDAKIGDPIKKTEENHMEKEIRGLEQFLKRQDGEEVRALQITTDGGAVIPENVEGSIVKKMEESSPIFAKARKFPSTAGSLKIAKETALSSAGFVGEGVDVAEIAMSLDSVTLTQKRVGAAISLSNQLINDVAVDIVGYATDLLARRAAKAVEKSMVVGTGAVGGEFAGIMADAGVGFVTTATALTIAMDDLVGLQNSLHPSFVGSSAFYCSRAFFNLVSKMKDADNHYFLQNGVVNGKITYTLLGAEVIVTDAITSAVEPCFFGDVNEAYGIMVKRGFAMQHVAGDTTQALRGSQMIVLDAYMDGAVYNTQALTKLKVKQS